MKLQAFCLPLENEKLTKIRDDLIKGKWETLGNAEFNTNNKTVYEHDILMDEQRAYYEDRIKNIEEIFPYP